jgi:hypothetical protein
MFTGCRHFVPVVSFLLTFHFSFTDDGYEPVIVMEGGFPVEYHPRTSSVYAKPRSLHAAFLTSTRIKRSTLPATGVEIGPTKVSNGAEILFGCKLPFDTPSTHVTAVLYYTSRAASRRVYSGSLLCGEMSFGASPKALTRKGFLPSD